MSFVGFGVLAAMIPDGCGGGNAPQPTSSGAQTGRKEASIKVTRDNACSVMLPTEVAEILGLKSEMREVVDEVTCRYQFMPATPSQSKSVRD